MLRLLYKIVATFSSGGKTTEWSFKALSDLA